MSFAEKGILLMFTLYNVSFDIVHLSCFTLIQVLVKIPAGVIHEVRRHYPHVLQRLRAKLKRYVDDYSPQHKLRLPRHSAGRERS